MTAALQHLCREQAQAERIAWLDFQVSELRMWNSVLQRQHLDDERRMHLMGHRS